MPMPAPGITTGNAFYCQPSAFKGAMFFYRFNPVLRTCGGLTARCAAQRRDKVLVYFDQHDKNTAHNGFQYVYYHLHFAACAESSLKSFSIFFSIKPYSAISLPI